MELHCLFGSFTPVNRKLIGSDIAWSAHQNTRLSDPLRLKSSSPSTLDATRMAVIRESNRASATPHPPNKT